MSETVTKEANKVFAALTRWLQERLTKWAEIERQLKPLEREAKELNTDIKSRFAELESFEAEGLITLPYRYGEALIFAKMVSKGPSFELVALELASGNPEAEAFMKVVAAEILKRTTKERQLNLKLSP